MRMLPILLVLAVFLPAPGAEAFTGATKRVELVPAEARWLVGHTGATPRNHVTDAPESFGVRNGGDWIFKKGGPTGRFTRLYGSGVPLDPAAQADGLVAVSEAEAFWASNPELLAPGVEPADLRFNATGEANHVRVVTHRQNLDGLDVLGSGAYLVIRSGRVVLMGARTFDVPSIETHPARTEAQASADAVGYLGQLGIDAKVVWADLAIMPLVGEDTLSAKLVYAVELVASQGRWTAYVDALEPAVFALRDERMFMTGNIQIEHHDRNPGGALVQNPGQYLALDYGTGTANTNLNGSFAISGGSPVVDVELSGQYVQVNNESGTDVVIEDYSFPDGSTYAWIGDGSEEQQAQLDAYAFTIAVRNHMRDLIGDLSFLDTVFPVHPNQLDIDGDGSQDYCNAWSDGYTINFLKAGGYGSYQCNNTAMISDVVFHEYGHSVHAFSAYSSAGSQVFDSSVSEGLADTTSVAMTGDAIIGPYFQTNGSGIRDLEPNLVWPDDATEEEHHTGLILGGALWDLRQELITQYGEAGGNQVTDEIFTMMMRYSAEMDTTYEAALVSDDDNGDLSDGTPNLCTINQQFAIHGLVTESQGLVAIAHEQITAIDDPAADIRIEATVSVASEECATLGDVTVIYSTDHGSTWTEADLENQGGDLFVAELPAQPEGTDLWYRLEAEELDSGNTVVKPYNDAEPYYTTYVGPLSEILCDHFDSESEEWTHELLDGVVEDGADDWMWGEPTGTGGDPSGSFSEGGAWGNDLAPEGENFNGTYQPEKVNTLRSPSWDLSEYDMVRLRFRRWLTVEDGFYDQAKVYVNEQEVWANAATTGTVEDPHDLHHIDREWVMYDVDITDLAAGESDVQVRWELSSDQGLQFGGWTIDDVCLYTRYVPEPQEDGGTGPGDTDSGDADGGTLFTPPTSTCGCNTADYSTASVLELLASLL